MMMMTRSGAAREMKGEKNGKNGTMVQREKIPLFRHRIMNVYRINDRAPRRTGQGDFRPLFSDV